MLTDTMGLIYAGEENPNLRELVLHRSIAALPIGGRYRAIDFLLSNMVHAGIRNVGIITHKNYKSLIDHLGSGKEWGLSRRRDGLRLLPPFDTNQNTHVYQGFCDAIAGKMDFLHRAPQQYCLLSGSYTLYSNAYEEMMRVHKEHHADVTMLYSVEAPTVKDAEHFKDLRMAVAEDGRVTDMSEENNDICSPYRSMDVYLMDKSLLEYLVQGAVSRGKHNFVLDVLAPRLNELRVYAVPHRGYTARLDSVSAYYDANMAMLTESARRDLFHPDRPVYTKIKDEPPVKYLPGADVHNCIFGDGCEIAGQLQDSVLFRGVKVGRGSRLKGAILMQDAVIGEDCELENVIIDKYVQIRSGVRLVGAPQFPVIIRKGAVI